MRTISYQELLDTLLALPASERNPDGACVYTTGDGRHCVIGQALVNLGAPVPEDGDGLADAPFAADGFQTWLCNRGVTIEPDAIRLGHRVQAVADHDFSWGYAINDALGNSGDDDDDSGL